MSVNKFTFVGARAVLAGLMVCSIMLCFGLSSGLAADEQRGTAEEAQALVAKAIAYYDSTNAETAFAAYNNREGEFVDRDLYIFVYGPDRTVASHGADVQLIGTAIDTLIDIHGKPFGAAIMDGATEQGVWTDYTWYNPVSRELHAKSSWIVLHDGFVFGAGIYLDDAAESEAVPAGPTE